MSNDTSRWEGLGITWAELKPGTAVMVATGTIASQVNGTPAIICYATVMGPADAQDASERSDMWWLNVHLATGATLPQMYRADQILGVPAVGLTMAGGPNPLDAATLGPSDGLVY